MGWFTSNISGTPNLYPTKSDYSKGQHEQHKQADKQQKINSHIGQQNNSNKYDNYRSKLYEQQLKRNRTTTDQVSQNKQIYTNQRNKKQYLHTKIKKLLQILHSKVIPFDELLNQIKKQHKFQFVCKKYELSLVECMKNVKVKRNGQNQFQITHNQCERQIKMYEECLMEYLK